MATVHSQRVLQEMEAAILSGFFKPRERLTEMALISQFGVSRTVIREALKRLEGKGLVRVVPYRGATVADLSVEEIEEIYFVRAAVEKIAAGQVCKHIRPAEIRGLKRRMKELERYLRERSPHMIAMDTSFHRAIFAASRNRYLGDIIERLRTQAYIVAYNAWSMPQRIDQSILEHRKMIQALEEGETRKFETLVVMHLAFSKDSYLSQLQGGKARNFRSNLPSAEESKGG